MPFHNSGKIAVLNDCEGCEPGLLGCLRVRRAVQGARILANLGRQVDQSDYDGDSADELTEIAKILQGHDVTRSSLLCIGRSAAWHSPPTVADAPRFRARLYQRSIGALWRGSGSAVLGGWITFAREFFDEVAKIGVYHRAVLGKPALHGGGREHMPHTVDLSFPNLDR